MAENIEWRLLTAEDFEVYENHLGETSLRYKGEWENIIIPEKIEGLEGAEELNSVDEDGTIRSYFEIFYDLNTEIKTLRVKAPYSNNVTDMGYMFIDCSMLTSLELYEFDTSNVTNMDGMFSGCIRLERLDLSSFDTSNVTNMANMFGICRALTTIDLSSFDTSSVKDMGGMFYRTRPGKVLARSKDDKERLLSAGYKGEIVVWSRKVVGLSAAKMMVDNMTEHMKNLVAGTQFDPDLKKSKILTEEEYNALSTADKNKTDTIYFIKK